MIRLYDSIQSLNAKGHGNEKHGVGIRTRLIGVESPNTVIIRCNFSKKILNDIYALVQVLKWVRN